MRQAAPGTERRRQPVFCKQAPVGDVVEFIGHRNVVVEFPVDAAG